MTQLLFPVPARPRWRSVLATLALVGALFAAGSVAPASAEVGTGPGAISGTATDVNGEPFAGAFVSAQISSGEATIFWVYAYTDATGHYEFTDLALSNTYWLNASAPGYQNPPGQDVTLTDAAPGATANFSILPYSTGAGSITGHVTKDGVPIAGQDVSANNYASSQYLHTTTDSDGAYLFSGLSTGEWNVYTWVPGTQPSNQSPVTISDAAPAATYDLSFQSWPVGTSSISGVATDAETGEPVQGAYFYLDGVDVPHQSSATGDEAGYYSFDSLPEGTYTLRANTSDGYLVTTTQVKLAAGESATVNVALVPADSTISGHIVGPDGAPAADVLVDITTTAGPVGGTLTDANGDYVIDRLGAIEYTLIVGGPGSAYERQTKTVIAIAHDDIAVNFTLATRSTAYLGGMLSGPEGDWYSASVCVTLYSSKSKKPVATQVTDSEGFNSGIWFFDPVKPGSYTAEFRDCDDDPATKFDKVFLGGVKNYKDATFVTVVAAQDTYDNNIQLTLRGK